WRKRSRRCSQALLASAGLQGQGTPAGRSGLPPRRLAPIGASAPSSTGPGSRIMACRAAAANRGDHSPTPARASTVSNSSRVDHIGCLSGGDALITPISYRPAEAAMWLPPRSTRPPTPRTPTTRFRRALARLGGLGQLAKPKPLISQGSSCKGLHYGPDLGAWSEAVIFGGGCSGRTSLSSPSSSLRSLSGSV